MEKKLGRPRSEKTRTDILNAAYDLLIEKGFEAVTVEKIAEKAGVSKATIYKWWANKSGVVMEAYLEATSLKLPIPDTGSVSEDMFIQVSNFVNFLKSREGNVLIEIIGEGQFDTSLAEIYRSAYFRPRRNTSKDILNRGILRGELRYDIDVEVTVDLIWGPIFYRILITGDMIDTYFIKTLINHTINGVKKHE